MKKLLIIFSLILIFPTISALNISLEYPPEVFVGEDISFELDILESTAKYQVKIELFDEESKRISRILSDGVWKSTIYYTIERVSKNGIFLIKVEDYVGMADIVVKLRDFEGNSYSFSGQDIVIKEKQKQNQISNDDEQEIIKTPPLEKEDLSKEIEKKKITAVTTQPIAQIPETIYLNPKTIKTEKSNKNIENKGYAKYSLVIFCVLLFFLYIIKPKQKKNEWNRKKNNNNNDCGSVGETSSTS